MDIDLKKPGVLGFGTVAKDSKFCFSIPFNSSPEQNEIDVCLYSDEANRQFKVEVNYTTVNGEYNYIHSSNLSSALPLSVGVTDSFRPKLLKPWKDKID